jgi:hypothetical protein
MYNIAGAALSTAIHSYLQGRFEHFKDCIDWWGGPKREGREEGPFT